MHATQLSVGVWVASPPIGDTLDSYARALGGRKMRPRSVVTYARSVRLFKTWLGADASVADITPASLGRYQASHAHLAAATMSKRLSAMRSYCRWCLDAGLRNDDPTLKISWPKKRKKLPRVLKTDELRQLEAILDRPPPVLDNRAGRIWRRNTRIVLLLLYAGLRRTEVSMATWEDVDLTEATLIVGEDAAKGGHERIVALHPRVVRELETTPPKARRGALAGHPDGRCISHKTIGHVFDRWLKDNGLTTSAHKLRHTCATSMLKSGANIHEIQRQLGHADIRTTEKYLHLDSADQHAAVRKLPDRLA
jgi:integrase/recombinase XerD